MTLPETRELLTSKQVCELLGITSNNLKQVVKRGHILAVKKKSGRMKQYVKSEVEAYLVQRLERGKK